MKCGFLLMVVLFAASGCIATQRAVAVSGETESLRSLAGEWEGTYSSHGSGRSGSILFNLTAEADTAFGEVIMFDPGSEAADPLLSRALTISFVRAEGNMVRGQLSPYTDPAPGCDCTLTTLFEGQLVGDRIEGTFASQSSAHPTILGMWQVSRK